MKLQDDIFSGQVDPIFGLDKRISGQVTLCYRF